VLRYPAMDNEPIFEASVKLPYGYALTARARPSTVKKTLVRLLPWAIYVAMPQGRAAKVALFAATRLSPLVKQKVR
jgi:hypothetical protein